MSDYISVREAAKLLGVRIEEVYKSLYSGKLTGFRDPGESGSSRKWKVNLSSVKKRIEERGNRGKSNKSAGV